MQAVVRYHEIALKRKNRPWFVDKLAMNLRRALADLPDLAVQLIGSRISVRVADEVGWQTLSDRLGRVFGVANFSRVDEAPAEPDLQGARTVLERALAGHPAPASFRITCKRSYKGFPLLSGTIERELGTFVYDRFGWQADLDEPELVILVEVLRDRLLVSSAKFPGPGGVPVGASGRVLALLSGGIDSPVAAWRLMKRGCNVTLANFHAFPLQDRTVMEKARQLAQSLTRWQYRCRLWLIPFGTVQQTIVAHCPAPLRVVLYRRFMLRVAEFLARREEAKALVTGESLGQVASQTLDNLRTIDEAAGLPVLRPLVGMDKDEIVAQARVAGTLDISTLPDQDCCQLFVPRSASVAAQVDEVLEAERALDVDGLVRATVSGAHLERYRLHPLQQASPIAASPR